MIKYFLCRNEKIICIFGSPVAAVATILTDKLGIDRRIEENLPNVSNAILIFSGWRLLSGSRPSPKRQVTRSLNKGNGKRPMVLKSLTG